MVKQEQPPDPQRLMEVTAKLSQALKDPMYSMKLGPVMLMNDEIIVTIISSLFNYMNERERYKATWNFLQRAAPDTLKNNYITLDLISSEEWRTMMEHQKMIRRNAPQGDL